MFKCREVFLDIDEPKNCLTIASIYCWVICGKQNCFRKVDKNSSPDVQYLPVSGSAASLSQDTLENDERRGTQVNARATKIELEFRLLHEL
jgi:hypothetical protein